MRWRFRNPSDARENAERARLESAIDRWWAAFAGKAGEIDALFGSRAQWDLGAWMDEHYHPIHDGLFWEFGPGLSCDGHRLVLTPETNRHLRPLVAEILRRAPALDGWELYPYRLPESIETTHETVTARTGGDLSGALCHVAPGENHLVDLTFYFPHFAHEDQDRRHFLVATEALLGEEILDKWIGAIAVKPIAEARGADPLEELPARVRDTIGQIQAILAPGPCFQLSGREEWSLLELEPPDDPDPDVRDYPHQRDLFLGKAMLLEMWKAAHSGLAFASERFSRVGETFCYVKLDGRDGLDDETFADKADIEDALDAALMPAGLGCHVGGGTGRWYSYVDLALTDVDKGLEVVRQVLSAGNVPRRSWILFFDEDWAHEWVGVYDDTPPPILIP